jgi:four helix bundle protein
MSTINQFEDLEVWKKARELSKDIYKLAQGDLFSKDFALKGQILRASGSIMDNIAEGFDRGGKKEFIQFLSIAKGSASEVKSQLYRSYDNNYIDEKMFKITSDKCTEICKMLKGFIDYLSKSDYKGTKYKI